MHKAMSGVVFDDFQTVQKAIGQTATSTGLTVVVRLNLKKYETSLKVDKAGIDPKRIFHHPQLPELNYRIFP